MGSSGDLSGHDDQVAEQGAGSGFGSTADLLRLLGVTVLLPRATTEDAGE